MPAIAIPLIAAAATTGGTIYAANKASDAAQPTAGEQAALKGQTNAANQQAQTGKQLTDFGLPLMRQSADYYRTLAGGNRAATAQTLAPDVANVQDVYGGTSRSISRFLRGPERDFQLAEASRERAGAVSSLFRNARPNAVNAMASLGSNAIGSGTSATSSSGSLFGAAGAQQQSNRFGGAALTHQAGEDFGGLLFQVLRGVGGMGGGKSSPGFAGLPSRQTVPGSTSWMPSGSGGGF